MTTIRYAVSSRRTLGWVAVLAAFVLSSVARQSAGAQTAAAAPELRIAGAIKTPIVLSASDLKQMTRKVLRVKNLHSEKTEAYEGVALEDLLRKAGAPLGEQLRGGSLAMYVVAEGADGYRVVFSLAELDSGFLDSGVLVADTLDNAPLPAGEGPFKLVAPSEKQMARWVRTLKSLTVARAPSE